MDIYSDGDRYGHKIEVTCNGYYTLYRLIYRGKPGDFTISEKKIDSGSLDSNVFESLKASVKGSGFFDLPGRLPEVSPRDVEFRTPARTIEITIRPDTDKDPSTVTAGMGVDRKHYPKDFLNIHRKMSEISRALLELYHSEN